MKRTGDRSSSAYTSKVPGLRILLLLAMVSRAGAEGAAGGRGRIIPAGPAAAPAGGNGIEGGGGIGNPGGGAGNPGGSGKPIGGGGILSSHTVEERDKSQSELAVAAWSELLLTRAARACQEEAESRAGG